MLTAVIVVLLVVAVAGCLYLAVSAGRRVSYIRRLSSDTSAAPPAGGPGFLNEGAVIAAQTVRRLDSEVAEAKAERDRLRATIDSSSSGIVALSSDGTIALLNAAARELLRPSQIEEGMPLARGIRDHEIISAVNRSRRDDSPVSVTIEYGPQRRPLQVNIDPLPSSGGWSALLVLADLTEVQRIEKTRREFVSNVSHELRTPLAAALAAVETLENGALEDKPAARSFLASIHTEVDRLTGMVEELLELSRIESGSIPLEIGAVEIEAIAAAAVERIRPDADRKEIEITTVIGDLPVVPGDSLRLEQALFNLLQNAVRFTPQGGAVEVLASADEGGVTVLVKDSGAGIPARDLPHVFERFYKADRARSSQGIGLGLAIVKHTIQAHGGSVFAESEAGRGSTVGFTLPLASDG
ncbi:MAG TPA: ATP-binding protein [Dehalococcoidia bacterium]|nr:ATP-binding protein [Dehalococcoidia bacterium]